MSGGIAYVLDDDGSFPDRVNLDMVDLESLERRRGARRALIDKHINETGSDVGIRVLLPMGYDQVEVREDHAP